MLSMQGCCCRLADCTGWDIDAVAPYDPPTITIIDRRLTSRRHILNIDDIHAHFKQRFVGAHVAVLYAEDMDLLGQIQAASRSSVFVVMHGAALANFIFLSQVRAHVMPFHAMRSAVQPEDGLGHTKATGLAFPRPSSGWG